MSKVQEEKSKDTPREMSPVLATANKTNSVLMIQPLENVNKELLYRQRQNRPFKVVQNLPIHKVDPAAKDAVQQPDYLTLKHPMSVKDSAVLYNSLIVSRFNWIHHIFKTYWTRREQIIRGLDLNKKDKMVRFCNPIILCGVHTFKIKLFFLKEDEREKAFRDDVEKRKEERVKRRQEKQEEMQRKKEAKEREEKEKELEREKLKQAYDARVEEEKKKQAEAAANPNITIIKPFEEKPTEDEKSKSKKTDPATPESKNTETTEESSKTPLVAKPKPKVKTDAKDIMANPESAIMIQNLNVLAKQDPHLNGLMKKVASGAASTEQILEFQKYIQKAKEMGDVTGYMQKLKIKQQNEKDQGKPVPTEAQKSNDATKSKEELQKEKLKLKEERQRKKKERETSKDKLGSDSKSPSPAPPKLQNLTPEEIQKKEEDLLKRAMEMRHEQEKQRLEKIKMREEKEREKIRMKQEKQERKANERKRKEMEKKQAKEERDQERTRKREKKLAEKEKARHEREEKMKERQLQKEKDKLDGKFKSEISRRPKSFDDDSILNDDDDDDDEDDRMGKLNNGDDDEDDDLWNDKLSPLQERYTTGASLVFEFFENSASRFTIPRDTIYELIDNEDDEEGDEEGDEVGNTTTDGDISMDIKNENDSGNTTRPKSPYVTLLASFLLVHNQPEIDGWERRQAEARAIEEEKERKRLEALKAEEEESSKNTIAENARKRRRKKSTWNSASTKRATRLSKQAKEIELLRREEEDFHEEDAELKVEDIRPIPIYSCVTLKFSKVPFRFASFILDSGNSVEDRKKNMEETMKIGTKVPLDQLWYQIDGIKDEILGETLRYNLNRLDYTACGGKKYRTMFFKKFGKGG